MKFLESFFSKMLDSSGRTSRNDFWMTILWIMLFNVSVSLIALAIGTFIKLPSLYAIVISVLNIMIFLSTISMQVRRLHDTNKSAWYLLINIVPVIGQVVVFVFYLMPGDQGANTYGNPVSL